MDGFVALTYCFFWGRLPDGQVHRGYEGYLSERVKFYQAQAGTTVLENTAYITIEEHGGSGKSTVKQLSN